MLKRIISLILIVSMLFGSLTAYAIIETPDIVSDTSCMKMNRQYTSGITELTHIDSDKIRSGGRLITASVLDDDIFAEYEEPDENAEISGTQINDTETTIPSNVMENDNYECLNEEDEEDTAPIEDEVIEGEIIPLNIPADSSRALTMPADSGYRMNNINNHDAFALKNQTGKTNFIGDNIGSEYVDPLSGNLIVTETDLVLPGVDGLDLNLSRYYSLAEAELYTKAVGIEINPEYNSFKLENGGFVVTETVTNTETNESDTYNYFYLSQNQANKRKDEIETRDTNNGLYNYSAEVSRKGAGEIVRVDYYYTSELTGTSYSRARSNLGAGWTWSFPSVEVIKDNPMDENEIADAIYYHDGKGNVMAVEYTPGEGYSFANYVGKDITFSDLFISDSDIYVGSRIDYVVDNPDGTKYYFGIYGELRTIMDIYGNKITFTYTSRDFYGAENSLLIKTITDSVGRTVSFDYNVIDSINEEITVTVSSPIAAEGTLSLKYNKRMIDVVRADGSFLSTEPILESVTNAIGEKTSYYAALINNERKCAVPVQFTFADKSFDSAFVYNTSGYANNLVYLLGDIVRPASHTKYYYDMCERNLGHSGVSQAYRVDERCDYEFVINDSNAILEDYEKNTVNYSYSREYTGYPYYNSIESMPDGAYAAKTTVRTNNYSIGKKFYKKDNAVLEVIENSTYQNPVGNALSITKTNTEFLRKQPTESQIVYSNGDYSYTSYTQKEYHYNNDDKAYGKIEKETYEMPLEIVDTQDEEKYSVRYQYDSDTGFLLNKSWYQNMSTKCTEYYRYNNEQRISEIVNADGSSTLYEYDYNTDTKVTKRKITTYNDIGSAVTEEYYTAEMAYAYPTTVIKTVTANSTDTTEATSYTYNMLSGVVTSKTDSDGTTLYEYDGLGRLTKVIYPMYNTPVETNLCHLEPEHDTFGKTIMPVEEFEYKTIKRDFDNQPNNEKHLIARQVYSSLTYYDVTGIANPTSSDSANLEYTFYEGEMNYYSGTGEILERNTAELVEGQNACVTTKYQYDTDANTITHTDAQGNSVTVQYDGLGREVKTTDKHGNYHILEYNISGNGAGFNAQSYFIAKNNAEQKENVVEYTLDRRQRLVNACAYSEYPDSYVNTGYEYDIVGNVISKTDPKGNTEHYYYDKLNRVIKIVNANNEVIENTYDNVGNITTQRINDELLYTKRYNGEGSLSIDLDNSLNMNLYLYDGKGRLEVKQDKNEINTAIVYNSGGFAQRIQNIRYGDAFIDRKYSYANPYYPDDICDAYWHLDSQNNVTTGYEYSVTKTQITPGGKVLSKENAYNANTGVNNLRFRSYSQYLYDSVGNITASMHSAVNDNTLFGETTRYTYDKDRLIRVQLDGNDIVNESDSINAIYEYYEDGKLKSVSYPPFPDGTVLKSEYTYDGLSRLKTLINYKGTQVLSSYAYTYDENSNIIKTVETVEGITNETVYTYDKLNRIATVSGSKGADSYYEYDERGNRKANYEQNDFLSEEAFVYTYTQENKLMTAESDDDGVFIDYNADGYRFVKSTVGKKPLFYIYDESGNLAAEVEYVIVDRNESIMYPVRKYIRGYDRVLAQIDIENILYYYIYNGHGDVVQIVDETGNIKNRYDYDVWGNFITKDETIENAITYFGQTYDEETGLYYLRARYYDPTTGRFTQQDPAEDGYNWYVYGNQNPVMYVDGNGESATVAAIGAILYEAAPYIAAAGAALVVGTVNFYKEHSKNKSKKNWDKHTKRRPGDLSKAQKKPGWQNRSNKRPK